MVASDAKKRKLENKYEPKNLFLKWCDHSVRSEKSTDKEESTYIPPMPPLEDDEEEVKEGKWLIVLTPNKVLFTLPILLTQIKARNNSYKLKNEIRHIFYFLYQHNKTTKKVYNNLIKLL